MATIDSAAAPWSDGRCRNQRSPRISDIQQRSKTLDMDGNKGPTGAAISKKCHAQSVSTGIDFVGGNSGDLASHSPDQSVTVVPANVDNIACDISKMQLIESETASDEYLTRLPTKCQNCSCDIICRKSSKIKLAASAASNAALEGIFESPASCTQSKNTVTSDRQSKNNNNNVDETVDASAVVSTTDVDTNAVDAASAAVIFRPSTLSASVAESRPMPVPTNNQQHHRSQYPSNPNTYHLHSTVNLYRNLPKTQSLDLADERSDEVVGVLKASTSSELPRIFPKGHLFDQTRPIYPNVPYSPYGSPYGSPRTGRRRAPLRESRRISIEQSGSFLQLNQYKLMDQIGQGSYGLVKLAYSEEDSTHYAMKILSKRKLLRKAGLMGRGPKKGISPLDRVYREIAVLKKLDHPNVVKLVEVLDDPLEDFLYLVFELLQLGEVLSIPTDQPLTEERAWSVFRDCLLGLEYLHYQRIIHGDIKPDNLLLGECGLVKIADLGVCNEFRGEDASMNNGSTAGTPAFRAPETLLIGQHLYSGKAADIWALGATLYALVFGNVPFLATNVPAVYEKIQNDSLQFPASCSISVELKDLIEHMLEKDPNKRITLPKIKEHPWVTNNNTNQLPSEEENCRLVQISEEDINSVVKSIPKLDTLILIKTMLKKHSFQNPFIKGISGRAPQRGGSRLERFSRAGRSNSAPGAYHLIERQMSGDNILPSVTEGVVSPSNESSIDAGDGDAAY